MPALYARGVYDYDETLGLVVFGNTFGELCMFNIANTDIAQLESCFQPFLIPGICDISDMLSTVCARFLVVPGGLTAATF